MSTATIRPPLVRSRDAVIGGVCTGLATHLGWHVRWLRVAFVVLALAFGAGALFYAWLWALVPLAEPVTEDAAVRRRAPVAAVLAIISVFAAVTAAATLSGDDAIATSALFVVSLASGAAVAWSIAFDNRDPERSLPYRMWTRVGASVVVLLAGAVALLSRPSAVNAILGVGMVVLGVGVLAAPRVVALWTDLMTERTARVREVQRAEIAAHLHDSVLQTLALIQNRAGSSSEVARIARAQERELRDWLFAGDEPVAADLATELRAVAASIELDHPVRIDVVTAGESVSAPSPLVAAAREAMLNAARHAGGDVSVYLETTTARDAADAGSGAAASAGRSATGTDPDDTPIVIDVFVRDRGEGVSLDDVPADRLGIRESIIGRMSRAGGTATVGRGAGGSGTEVHLHLEVAHD